MPTYNDVEVITAEQANACLAIVQAWIDKTAGPGWEPALYEPGHEGNYWNISLEGAQDDWPWLMSNDELVIWPDGVRVEAGASWYISLLPTG